MTRKWCVLGLTVVLGLTTAWVCTGSRLIISEIAWGGTDASASDEWIELQNAGEELVDLSGWVLLVGDSVISLGTVEEDTIEVRTVVLEPGAFLVLERTDDMSISDVVADLIYRGGLANAGTSVELKDPAGTVVDSVHADAGWPAGSLAGGEPPYGTMERDMNGGWMTNAGSVRNGLDAAGNPLNGTPGRVNSDRVLAQRVPAVVVTHPAVDGMILKGTVVITWTATDPDGSAAALALSVYLRQQSDLPWTLVMENVANTGAFSWDTASLASGAGYQLLIRAVDGQGYVGEGTSSVFVIQSD